MIFDKGFLFDDAVSLAQAAGSYLSSFSFDTWQGNTAAVGSPPIGGPLINDIGRATTELDLIVQIVTTFTSGGAATLQVQIVMADDATLATNLVVLDETRVHALADLVAGKYLELPGLPPGVTSRFLGLRYIIGTAAMTAGAITAGFTKGRQTNRAQV